jgi:ATP-dependent Clp protease, protease subunit
MPKENEPKENKDNASFKHLLQKKFLEERKLFFSGVVETESAQEFIEKVLYLEWMDNKKDITLYLNSPGGSTIDGLLIYDTLKLMKSPLTIIVTGLAASMGSIILCAAKKGRRFLLPHAQVLIHQPHITGKMQGVAVDINIFAKNMEKTRRILNTILAEASGQAIEKVQKDSERDFYMDAQEAIDYGLADSIIKTI